MMTDVTAWEDEELPIEEAPAPEYEYGDTDEAEVVVEDTPPTPPPTPGTPVQEQEYADTTLWKKWSVSGGVGRFLTVRPWAAANKVAIDIGETDGAKLKGHTQVWANLLQLTAYLKAVRDGRGVLLYKAGQGMPAEGYSYFGGAMGDGVPVSRILKIHHWPSGKDGQGNNKYDDTAFMWKSGHFEAEKSKTGAFIPKNMAYPKSFHSIKMTRLEMSDLALAMEMAMINHAANTRTDDWLEQISGRKR